MSDRIVTLIVENSHGETVKQMDISTMSESMQKQTLDIYTQTEREVGNNVYLKVGFKPLGLKIGNSK